MAFLDETGLTELWSLVKAEDTKVLNRMALNPKIEKIADVTVTNSASNFYIELPNTLSHYPIVVVKGIEFRGSGGSGNNAVLYSVDSLTSSASTNKLCNIDNSHSAEKRTSATILFNSLSNSGNGNVVGTSICAYRTSVDTTSYSFTDTKYLRVYCSVGIGAGSRLEIWGVVE